MNAVTESRNEISAADFPRVHLRLEIRCQGCTSHWCMVPLVDDHARRVSRVVPSLLSQLDSSCRCAHERSINYTASADTRSDNSLTGRFMVTTVAATVSAGLSRVPCLRRTLTAAAAARDKETRGSRACIGRNLVGYAGILVR